MLQQMHWKGGKKKESHILHRRNVSTYGNKLKRCICSAYFLIKEQGMQRITASTNFISSGWSLKALLHKRKLLLNLPSHFGSPSQQVLLLPTLRNSVIVIHHITLFRRYRHLCFGSPLKRKLNPNLLAQFHNKIRTKNNTFIPCEKLSPVLLHTIFPIISRCCHISLVNTLFWSLSSSIMKLTYKYNCGEKTVPYATCIWLHHTAITSISLWTIYKFWTYTKLRWTPFSFQFWTQVQIYLHDTVCKRSSVSIM